MNDNNIFIFHAAIKKFKFQNPKLLFPVPLARGVQVQIGVLAEFIRISFYLRCTNFPPKKIV